jgi:hypothetical protein
MQAHEDAAPEVPEWLQLLSFGDAPALRFPLVVMGVALLSFISLVEVLDGWWKHLDHLIPFGVLILAALLFRRRLVKRYPQPLPPM